MYLCRNIRFIAGACIGMQNKGLADLTPYESKLKDYSINHLYLVMASNEKLKLHKLQDN